MSVRLFTIRLAKHGRYLLQSYWRRDIHTNIWEQQHNNAHKTRTRSSTIATAASATASQTAHFARHAAKHALKAVSHTTQTVAASNVPRSGIFRFGQHARKLFIDNILSRVTTTYSEELRQKATKKLFYGDSAPFFALVGVSLASGAGVLTKEDELEGVCWEIREAASRLQSSWNHDEISESLNSGFNVDKLDVGPPIAKGCAAVVYAASFKGDTDVTTENTTQSVPMDSSKEMGAPPPLQQQSYRPELMTPIQQTSRFVHNFGASVDNLHVYSQSSAAAAFVEELATRSKKEKQDEEQHENGDLPDTLIPDALHKLQSATVSSQVNINRYPLALKLMFNYDIQSNALSILRAMYKETVPARQRHIHAAAEDWERLLSDQTLTLPPHPNIVCMYGFFCDEVRNFPDGHLLYPIAQPQRINPHGYGRNMSLYLLMKRYDYTLRSLLDTHQLSTRTKLLLLAQLLEAVAHINRHGIAHRDLKSDNILIELNDDQSPPVLVLSDFGCCLADKVHGLQLPYTSADIDKGGNAALMAPEIINKQPGPFAVLNYGKADLWACGAIAYEIFGLHNPFYSASGGRAAIEQAKTNSLRNNDYKEHELPALNDECPAIVQELILNILNPNPSKRVSPDIAANVMQLYLWAPSKWLKNGGMPNSPEILQWLLSLSTKVMCEGHPGLPLPVTSAFGNQYQLNYQQNGRRTYVEYLLICSFLSRAHLRRIRGALNWIQSVVV